MDYSKLETYRQEDIAKTSFYNPTTKQILEFTVHDRAIQSFYLSMQAIEQLEQATYAFPLGQSSVLAVGSWFIAIESMVNSILKIASASERKINFEELKSKTLGMRFGRALDILEVNKVDVRKSNIFAELNEFMNLRNEMFHDRTYEKPLTFKKTLFSSSATSINQIDVIQAFQIFLKIAQIFRYSVAGSDLMPSILINREDKVFFSKLDCLYRHMIVGAFPKILKKHHLNTSLELTLPTISNDLILRPLSGWSLIIKSDQKIQNQFVDRTKTMILENAIAEWVRSEGSHLNNQTFGVPNYKDSR